MSATGRGAERAPQDFYATPGWTTRALAQVFPEWFEKNERTTGAVILEPCCGAGAILRELHPSLVRTGLELDEVRAAQARASEFRIERRDALDATPWVSNRPPIAIVTNPPYSLAAPFIDRALREVDARGTVAMLLRLNYLGSRRRGAWHRAHPSHIYVLERRPSFTGGGTDATEYAWFVWDAESRDNGFGRVSVLECEKS